MFFQFRNVRLHYRLAALLMSPLLVLTAFLVYLSLKHDDIVTLHWYTLSFLSLALIVYAIFAWNWIKDLSRGLASIKNSAQALVKGKASSNIANHQIPEVRNSLQYLHAWTKGLQQQTWFADQLVTGNLDATYIAQNGDDVLGKSLLRIREHLISIKQEDQQRNWAAEGLAKFVALLQNTKDLKGLSNEVILSLVKAINANQGALFLVERDSVGEEFLEMKACYAYNRSKHFEQRISPGEGLIGQAFLERDTVYLKEVPDQFVRITSGLGEANPKNILIVPLKASDVVVGMVEIASFKHFQKHEIAFIEKICENIAHTVSSVRTAENTRTLLNETQAHAEQMRAQEEELRQNQEELQATQEEISRKYNILFKELLELNYASKFDQLKSITFARKRNIEYYFDIIRSQILTFSEDRMIIEAVKAFRHAFSAIESSTTPAIESSLADYYEKEFLPRLNDNIGGKATIHQFLPASPRTRRLQYTYISNNPHPTGQKSLLNDAGDGSEYSRVHSLYHPIIRNFLEKFGYYDIFLLDPVSGDMVYSVFKEVDFATSLFNDLYSTTNFGKVAQEARDTKDKNFVRLVDFKPYDPSYHAPASFIASPVYEGDEKIGILVFQMPINKINQILTGNNHWIEDGLGKSGETIMVGEDYTLRSIVRAFIEDPEGHLRELREENYEEGTLRQINKMQTTILLERVSSDAVTSALHGKSGTQMERDATGAEMLYAYAPLQIPDVHWVILSRMTEAEASLRINDFKTMQAL